MTGTTQRQGLVAVCQIVMPRNDGVRDLVSFVPSLFRRGEAGVEKDDFAVLNERGLQVTLLYSFEE